MIARLALRLVLAASAGGGLVGCEGGDESPPAAPDAAILTGTPQEPPQGQASIEPWLAAGHYLTWRCEMEIFPPRLGGAHGRHRICSNETLMASEAGPYPVGAASVKELFDGGDKPNGYAVGLKVVPGEGPETWYWYERTGRLATLRPVADGIGVGVCGPSCHQKAPRDNVYIRAP